VCAWEGGVFVFFLLKSSLNVVGMENNNWLFGMESNYHRNERARIIGMESGIEKESTPSISLKRFPMWEFFNPPRDHPQKRIKTELVAAHSQSAKTKLSKGGLDTEGSLLYIKTQHLCLLS
jgi:hypothetical protein